MGKNSVFWKWMISYVAVMLVFLLCNSITYWQGKRILLRNQETENEKIVEQICDNLTNIEETMRDLSYSVLAQEDTILLGKNSYHGKEGSATGATKYSRYTLCELLREYQKINGNYASILLCFVDDEYIVSSDSANTEENYWRTYQSQYGGIPKEQWIELLQGTYNSITMKYGNEQYVFLREQYKIENGIAHKSIFSLFMNGRNCSESCSLPRMRAYVWHWTEISSLWIKTEANGALKIRKIYSLRLRRKLRAFIWQKQIRRYS